ncbi:SEL1-like repeat protein [Nocardia sp. NPDC004573]
MNILVSRYRFVAAAGLEGAEVGESELREQFFRQVDDLYQAAGSPPEQLIAEKTKISITTIRGWLPSAPEKPTVQRKRVVPRNGDQFARLVEFLIQRPKGRRPDRREIDRWDRARRAALTSATAADAFHVAARAEVEHAGLVWLGIVEQVGADGGLPHATDLDPHALGAIPSHVGLGDASRFDRYVPRTANQVDRRVMSALKSRRMVVLTGPSKTGKTRTLYENVRRTLPQARILVPSRRTLKAAIDLPEFRDCGDQIVVWLDDLQDFLAGENPLSPILLAQISARPARTVIAATIRDDAIDRLTRSTGELTRDQRTVLAQAETIRLRSTSDDVSEHAMAATLYPSLNLGRFGLAEVLAGAPDLLRQYEVARHADPALGAVTQTVIDWSRIGRTDPMPHSQLQRLSRHVLEHHWPHVDIDGSALEDAIAAARMPREGAGQVAALHTERLVTGERAYRPFDYLVAADDGQDRPARAIPHDYWEVATRDADPDVVTTVGFQAHLRGHDEIADNLWRRGAGVEHPGALYNLAVSMQVAGKLSEADELYRRAAAVGCVPAFANIGVLCAERNNLGEAEVWYRRGAEAGDAAALRNLATLLTKTRREGEAEHVLALSVGNGDPVAMFNYAHALQRHGDRMTEVEHWFLQAASAGHAGAAVNLACIMFDRKDFEAAEHWYGRAHQADPDGEAGLRAAQGLGAIYVERENLQEAEIWIRRAAAAGDTTAVGYLGRVLYLRGDIAAAEELLRLGAEAGDLETMRSYAGLLHDSGRGEEALPYLRRGAAADHLPSMSALWQALYLRGEHGEADRWLERCAAAGDLDAMFRLGFRHVQADNLKLGEKWYRKAAAGGHRPAMNNLAILLNGNGEEAESQQWLGRARNAPPSNPASPRQAT